MATVTRNQIAHLHDKIIVTLTKEDYLPGFEKSLKQYAKQANVPGFRKGNVPSGMIRKMYGQSLFQDEVLRQAGRSLEDYLSSEKVAIFAQPMVLPSEKPQSLDMNAPSDVDFEFEIGLKPDFKIPALENGTALTRYTVAVSDAMVEDEVKRTTRRFGAMEHPDAVESQEDVIYISSGNTEEGGEESETPLMIERLPEALRQKAIGMKAGDSLTITPSTDFTDNGERNAFLKDVLKAGDPAATYTLNITKVGRIKPAEINADLFAQVFQNDDIADETAFRDRIRQELQREYDRVAGERLNNEIFETLVHTTPIELPVAFLKRWLREGGEDNKPKSPQQVEQEFPGFDHQLRWTLISDKLIGDLGVSVSAEEVKQDIQGRVLAYFGMHDADDAPWLDGYMQKVVKDEKMMNETYRRLLFDRLFDALRNKFAVEEKELTEAEFFALPAPGGHHHHH
jgi:trigger factor